MRREIQTPTDATGEEARGGWTELPSDRLLLRSHHPGLKASLWTEH